MASEKITTEFDEMLAEILREAPEAAITEVTVSDEPEVTPPPVLKMETIGDTVKFVPAQQVTATEVPKGRYRTDDGKTEVEGHAPFTGTVYSKGYLQLKFKQTWNKCSLYRDEFAELKEFFRSEACDTYEQLAESAGWKSRPSKGG
jgi:hypothetical protein